MCSPLLPKMCFVLSVIIFAVGKCGGGSLGFCWGGLALLARPWL